MKKVLVSIRYVAPVLFAVMAHAQTDRGAIRGTAEDPSGAVVPGAHITATNIATNTSYTALTNSVGDYNIPALEPGTYRMVVGATGFKNLERQGIIVTVGGIVGLNLHMALEAVRNFE